MSDAPERAARAARRSSSTCATPRSLAHWDQQTMMPSRGGACPGGVARDARAHQPRAVHRRRDRAGCSKAPPPSSTAPIRTPTMRAWCDSCAATGTRRAACRPSSRPSWRGPASLGQEAWIAARARLGLQRASRLTCERNFELARRYVDCPGSDEFECRLRRPARRLRAADARRPRSPSCSRELRAELVPVIATVRRASTRGRRRLAVTASSRSTTSAGSSREVVALMGFDRAGWRLDDTVHPFATRHRPRRRPHHDPLGRELLPRGAVRGDARVRPRAVRGRDPAIARAHARSAPASHSAMHESQSRLWENMVGRGRPFCGGAGAADRRARSAARCRASTPTRCIARSTGSSRPSSASRPTRRPTRCTSCCASSSSRS